MSLGGRWSWKGLPDHPRRPEQLSKASPTDSGSDTAAAELLPVRPQTHRWPAPPPAAPLAGGLGAYGGFFRERPREALCSRCAVWRAMGCPSTPGAALRRDRCLRQLSLAGSASCLLESKGPCPPHSCPLPGTTGPASAPGSVLTSSQSAWLPPPP